MKTIIRIVGQQMKPATTPKPFVQGQQCFAKFQFELDSDWKGLRTFAQFTQNGTAYNQYLDDENCAYLPAEIQPGKFTVMLYGTTTINDGQNSTTVVGTTNYLTYTMDANNFIGDAHSTEISQTLYDQLVSMVNTYQSQVADKVDLSTYNTRLAQVDGAIGAINNSLANKAEKMEVNNAISQLASKSDLQSEKNRAENEEGAIRDSITTMGNTVNGLSSNIGNVVISGENGLDARVTAIENDPVTDQMIADKIQELITSDAIASMVIEDGSVGYDKFTSSVKASLDLADSAMQEIGDGTITRAMVNSAFEATLAKADTAMQATVYDPNGYGTSSTPIDPYTYADHRTIIVNTLPTTGIDTNANYLLNTNGKYSMYRYISNEWVVVSSAGGGVELHTRVYTIDYFGHGAPTAQHVGSNYLDLDSLTAYIYTEDEQNSQSSEPSNSEEEETSYEEQTTYSLETDIIVSNPSEGVEYYLQFGTTTELLHFIYDETEEEFIQIKSSSTQVVDTLPLNPNPNVDYILNDDGTYVYYKYIDDEWVLISGGSNVVMLGYNESTSAYNSYMMGTGNPDSTLSTAENYQAGLLYLKTPTMVYYYIDEDDGAYSWVSGGTLVESPSDKSDYLVKDNYSAWEHFRYIGASFEQIGSSGYSRVEVDELLDDLDAELSGDISDVASDVADLQTTIDNLANMVTDVTLNDAKNILVHYADDTTSEPLVLDKGTDIDDTAYSTDDNTLRFYDSNGDELEGLAVVIEGGGGGGAITSGSVIIGRVTPSSVQNIHGDDCTISYTVTAKDAGGEVITTGGLGTLYINNIAVSSGFQVNTATENALNTIEVGQYLSVGTNAVKISVSVDTGGESNTVSTKTWSVNSINMYLVWNYTDSQVNQSAFSDYYIPYGAVDKTIYTFIDVDPIGFNPEIVDALPDLTDPEIDVDDIIGVNYFVHSGSTYTHYVYDENTSAFVTALGSVLNATSTTRSGSQQSMTIPMQTHGSHAVVRNIVSTINGTTIKTNPIVHDMIFVVAGNNVPIISTSFNTAHMIQYNTVQIPIVVYNPMSSTSTVVLKENGTTVSTWTGVDRTTHYWNYSPTTYGTKTLTITCSGVTKTIVIEVEELDIDEEEVTGYDFRFKASEFATNDAVQNWSNSYTPQGSAVQRNVNITFSPNFDWVNGGLHTETDENGYLRQYFCVRAGTTATFNYNLFDTFYDPKQYGKSFKAIFKAVNCRTYDANVFTCMDTSQGNNGVGLIATANEATLTTANNSIKTYYCKDSYIEFEFNIHPNTDYPYLQFWMDGSPDCTKLYDSGDGMQQVTPVGITVGSPNCDVYIYMMKAYPTFMTNDNELSNFIMDAPNAYEMVSRFNRNNILTSGEIDPAKLASLNPNLRVLYLDVNRMSTGKKDNVVAYTVRQVYNAGGQKHCFTIENACVTIQGTSSVGYLESAGNVDINFKYGRTFTSDNVSYTTGEILFDDSTTSTSGYAMTDNSIPVDYMNVKVNVASSENANNACIADWYNIYQPWLSPVRAKKSKARDTMQFMPGAIFIRDHNPIMATSDMTVDEKIKCNLFSDTNNYHFYGICDIGNSKKNTKVFHDTTNPMAVCMEVSNNTSLPCLMHSDTYTWNEDDAAVVTELVDGELKEQIVFEFRYVEDGMESVAETNWDRFVKFMVDNNPNAATNESIASTTFGAYTFKGSGSFDTSSYDSEDYNVVYLYGYGLPTVYNGGLYAATDYVTDTTNGATCYYYINYTNNYIYSSDGTSWTAIEALTWIPDQNSVLAGTSIGTYAGTYTTDSYEYRMANILQHCEEYMVIDPVVYHFIFIESFLMTDNVAKNTFWSTDDGVHWELSKDYDNDRFCHCKTLVD